MDGSPKIGDENESPADSLFLLRKSANKKWKEDGIDYKTEDSDRVRKSLNKQPKKNKKKRQQIDEIESSKRFNDEYLVHLDVKKSRLHGKSYRRHRKKNLLHQMKNYETSSSNKDSEERWLSETEFKPFSKATATSPKKSQNFNTEAEDSVLIQKYEESKNSTDLDGSKSEQLEISETLSQRSQDSILSAQDSG